MVILTAKRWGWQNPSVTKSERQRIARAACNQISYDYGFRKEIACSQITKWNQQIDSCIVKGSPSKVNPLSPLHAGSKKYIEIIENKNEGYIRYLFRYAQSVKGTKATYHELAEYMNLKSDVEGETRPTLYLST